MGNLLGMRVRAKIVNLCNIVRRDEYINKILAEHDGNVISVKLVDANHFIMVYRLEDDE